MLENIYDLEYTIREIYWRLSNTKKWKTHLDEAINLLEILRIRLTEKKTPLSDWIALRLLQEESKKCIISSTLENYLPVVCKISLVD